MLIIMVS